MRSKYINPFTDYGFKRLFGEEANKHLLIAFLNDILPIEHKIYKLEFKKNEVRGDTAISRKTVYDIFCEDIFIEAFKSAEIANFTDEESLMIMRDNINVINTAKEE